MVAEKLVHAEKLTRTSQQTLTETARSRAHAWAEMIMSGRVCVRTHAQAHSMEFALCARHAQVVACSQPGWELGAAADGRRREWGARRMFLLSSPFLLLLPPATKWGPGPT